MDALSMKASRNAGSNLYSTLASQSSRSNIAFSPNSALPSVEQFIHNFKKKLLQGMEWRLQHKGEGDCIFVQIKYLEKMLADLYSNVIQQMKYQELDSIKKQNLQLSTRLHQLDRDVQNLLQEKLGLQGQIRNCLQKSQADQHQSQARICQLQESYQGLLTYSKEILNTVQKTIRAEKAPLQKEIQRLEDLIKEKPPILEIQSSIDLGLYRRSLAVGQMSHSYHNYGNILDDISNRSQRSEQSQRLPNFSESSIHPGNQGFSFETLLNWSHSGYSVVHLRFLNQDYEIEIRRLQEIISELRGNRI